VYDTLEVEELPNVTIETGQSATLYCVAIGCQDQLATCYCVKCEDMFCTQHQQVYIYKYFIYIMSHVHA